MPFLLTNPGIFLMKPRKALFDRRLRDINEALGGRWKKAEKITRDAFARAT
ncbi:hypothetical protein [Paraburkholderia sp. ZP32-5]|uniref:hypothetical protein n=1 Tax=Paraburkholderia sp. ZP32-5 TaxID=2883245 RepID=UPI001F2A5F90|nr:hypothetical protein [Paraburkholderia sp. ZP32-5]